MITRLAGSFVVLLMASLFFGSVLVGSLGAESLPKGILEVTGYQQIVPAGSSGPVTVVAKGETAAAIRSALAGLDTSSPPPPGCMEPLVAFEIRVLTNKGAPPTYLATGMDCPTPGIVAITVDGTTKYLRADCSLRAAVDAALPRGRAEGTRRVGSHCSH